MIGFSSLEQVPCCACRGREMRPALLRRLALCLVGFTLLTTPLVWAAPSRAVTPSADAKPNARQRPVTGKAATKRNSATGRPTSQPVATASMTAATLKIDGRLDEAAWREAKKFGDFVERKPRLRARPTERTWFAILYDGAYLYIGVFCGQRDSRLIRARTTARDSRSLFSDDAISIKIDAMMDRRTTTGFVMNPAGARLDYRGINESQMRREFDTRWFGAAAKVPGGWAAEFRIPWASLGIDPADPPAAIGLNLSRDHAVRNATYDWALMPPPFSPISASLYGKVVGFERLIHLPREATSTTSSDTSFRVVPWVLAAGEWTSQGSANATAAGAGFDSSFNGGVDARLRLGGHVRAQVTVNTDFAQANVDDQVINLSRFSLFMPEKREFFLRDIEVFTFGRSGSTQLFHSRRIGLNAGQPIPIFLGLKAVAEPLPSFRFGLLDVVTRSVKEVGLPWTNHSVARGQWQAGDGSNIGLMWTHRQSLDKVGDHNSVLGVDGAFRGAGTPLLIEGFTVLGRNGAAVGGATADVGAVSSDSLEEQRVRAGSSVRVRWRGAVVRPEASYSWFDNDFRADLGFYRRVGVHTGQSSLAVEPRIGAYGLEKLNVMAWLNGVADREELLDRSAGGEVSLFWNSGFVVGARAEQTQVTVQEAFTVGRNSLIPPNRYQLSRLDISLGTPWVRTVAMKADFQLRDYFGGTMARNSGTFVVRPGGLLRLEAGWILSRVTFPDDRPDFLAAVINGRAAVGFSPDLNMDIFVGWNRLEQRIPVNVRLRWTWRRGSDVFVVWQGAHEGGQGWTHRLLAKWTWSLP